MACCCRCCSIISWPSCRRRHSAATSVTAPSKYNVIYQSFWLLGLLNNSPWVLMLAVATNISSGGVALVFLSNIIPGLLVKLSAPYWFHRISYQSRIVMASIATGLACILVGWGGIFREEEQLLLANNNGNTMNSSSNDDVSGMRWGLTLQLLGVSFISLSCSLGEASLLALAGKFDGILLPAIATASHSYRAVDDVATHSPRTSYTGHDLMENIMMMDEHESEENSAKLIKVENNHHHQRACITAFASGTGLAGIVGYGYKALFSDLCGWSLSATVWSAVVFPLAYNFVYRNGVHNVELRMHQIIAPSDDDDDDDGQQSRSLYYGQDRDGNVHSDNQEESRPVLEMVNTEMMHLDRRRQTNTTIAPQNLTAYERFKLVLSLWKYTIPLFTVYAAEYMLQAGVWPAIGFPVTSASARAQFYQYSNWTYQAGVFISRSSGNFCIASVQVLWLMPFLQVLNLYFFWLNSIQKFWYNYSLLLPCFVAGLLGGGVYVQGFARVNTDMPVELKEFAVASIGVADSLGILVADVFSLFIQSCIFKKNNIEGAVADCPLMM